MSLQAQTKIVQIEGVYKGIDYSREIKRSQFEATADDLKAGLTFEDVMSVILMGGASQTPMIQRTVKATVGEGKVAFDVNADEATVIGASLSHQVKTKDIEVSDICMYNIQASYTTCQDYAVLSGNFSNFLNPYDSTVVTPLLILIPDSVSPLTMDTFCQDCTVFGEYF
ncbi:hypothetical protein BDM02DRAFT_3193339 [Thelephora ganbajun]|uniref:Uncharacterized protein n=1 Tax=Thelephora ganbajun TaxID=370292 RepID=A0ACB6YZ23_THEGA|nr:hypothetical protein BDM02DRAFT_3193339 [Thelephora ganbajun]